MATKLDISWNMLVLVARRTIEIHNFPKLYSDRLEYELTEVEQQGANNLWVNYLNDRKKFESNPNKLLLPWLLKMIAIKTGDHTYRNLTTEEWLAQDPIATRDIERDGPILTTSCYNVVTALPKVPIDIRLDPDKPDIDLDCIPEARDILKEHAAQQYNHPVATNGAIDNADKYGFVCSVGTWTTYKLKSALQDVYQAYGYVEAFGKKEIMDLTTHLPDDVDDLPDGGYSICKNRVPNTNGEDKECGVKHNQARCPMCESDSTEAPTIGKLLDQHETLRDFNSIHPDIVEHAVGLIGRIRSMGMHAGAIIISDCPLYGNLPLSGKRPKKDEDTSDEVQWISMWTEGRNTQLSKFGFIKWDILGLKNLKYIQKCCELVENSWCGELTFRNGNNPIAGWDNSDPIAGTAGCYWKMKDNTLDQVDIPINDPVTLELVSNSMTDGVFQFDTQLAKRILENGVANFRDMMLFNAMGHPGPMDSIPEAVANRNASLAGNDSWKDELRNLDPIFLEELESTYGVICFQEQLASIWQRIAGFTAPEAQDARKAVAKKWRHLLVPIEKKWMDGASRKIGIEAAKEWWTKMVTFGRYAFNMSHAVSYSLVAFKCAYLKAHHPAEWWAAVMSDCHPEKLIRYVGVAKAEKQVEFAALDINNLTYNFTVTSGKYLANGDVPKIHQGLIGIKGIGAKSALKFEGTGNWKSIDDFIEHKPRSKAIIERLIKLGSFSHLHPNRRSLWMWYLYKYASPNDEVKNVRKAIELVMQKKSKWTPETIEAKRQEMIAEFHKQFPRRQKIPAKILKWQPPLIVEMEDIVYGPKRTGLFKDYTATEILDFEKKYIGYYLTNPLGRYKYDPHLTISLAKENGQGIIHAIVTECEEGKTKNEDIMYRICINDGQSKALLLLWSDEYQTYADEVDACKAALLNKAPEVAVQVAIRWSHIRDSATLFRPSKSNYQGSRSIHGSTLHRNAGQNIKTFTLLEKCDATSP